MTERRGSRPSVGDKLIIGGMIAAPVIGVAGWVGFGIEAKGADYEMRRQALIAAASLTPPDPSNDSAAKLQDQQNCIRNGGEHGSFQVDEMIGCLDGTNKISEETLSSMHAAADSCTTIYATLGAMHIAFEDR